MKSIFEIFFKFAKTIRFIPELLSRLTVGYVFAESGWGKLHHLSRTIDYFTSLGIPSPKIQAPMVAGLEFLCGILLVLGLATRLAAIPLIGIMLVAIKMAKWDEVTDISTFVGLSEYLYLVILFWLLAEGAGRLSVDSLLRKK